MLQQIYQAGILAARDVTRLERDTTHNIKLVENNTASVRRVNALYTTKAAYEYILSADTLHYKRTYLQQCDLNQYISSNLTYDEHRSKEALDDLLNHYSWSNGVVQSGQKIIDRGDIIDKQTYNILESLRRESIKRGDTLVQRRFSLVGQVTIVAALMLIFMIYLQMFRKVYYRRLRSTQLIFLLIVIYCVVTALIITHNVFNVYIIPYAMLPLILHVFLDSRTASLAHLVTIFICSLMIRYPYDFLLVQLPAGLVAVMSLRELSQRSQLFRSAFLVWLTYMVTDFAYQLSAEGDINKLDYTMFVYLSINGVLLLFTYPLLFMIEKIFGFTSNVTLVELSNINSPLLRRLSEDAPGTFQHSMLVGNLAAEAIYHIGGNTQLARTGALYHDIGKVQNPAFFTENQLGGINPHKGLSYEESAKIVIQHVYDGLKLASKYNLPAAVTDFIRTHHGTGKTKFFYISWKNEHPSEEPDETLFTYPGPNPSTKETAVVMMADAVEASSRSLTEYSEQSISELINRIIDGQMADGLFRDAPLTFRDIQTVKEVFIEKLMTTYHTRIRYPEEEKVVAE
jgi:putative nucleotidyltransferase with HDIG domain